jgi:hypothetical protein
MAAMFTGDLPNAKELLRIHREYFDDVQNLGKVSRLRSAVRMRPSIWVLN